MRATKAVEFDAGHRVPLHDGQCRFVHGHRYRVAATVEDRPGRDGMVLDFGVVKALLLEVVEPWDHAFLSEVGDPVGEWLEQAGQRVVWFDAAPTAETLAEAVAERVLDRESRLVEVTVWETPSSWATWTRR